MMQPRYEPEVHMPAAAAAVAAVAASGGGGGGTKASCIRTRGNESGGAQRGYATQNARSRPACVLHVSIV
jgi:hypothetical protein